MPEYYSSKVIFEEVDIKRMCDDIGEILGRLRHKSVFDYKSRRNVLLADKKSVDIEYKKNDILEVKRFAELVSRHLPSLTYLVRCPISESLTNGVERSDRIMGSINYEATYRLRQRELQSSSKVVCFEIYRSFDTPENRILALALLSIANYCDRYIFLEGLVEARDRIEPTMEDLKKIRTYVTALLSSKPIKQILSTTSASPDGIDRLFTLLTRRIVQNKISPIYMSILKLLYEWKDRLYIQYKDISILKDILLYHALKLEDKNKLYEAWVFYHLLDRLVDLYGKRFVEISGHDDAPIFTSEDHSVTIKYQPSFGTGWTDNGQPINDNPDIVIETDVSTRFVIDAKNSQYTEDNPRPNFRQMRSYLDTTNANFGIFIHSETHDAALWKVVENNTGKTIVWTSFSPHFSKTATTVDYSSIIKLIEFIKEKGANH